MRKFTRRRRFHRRSGVVEFEAVMTLGVMFPLAVALYVLAIKGYANLHELMMCSLGWPFL